MYSNLARKVLANQPVRERARSEPVSRSQEIGIVLPRHLPGKVLRSKVILVPLRPLGSQRIRLLLEQLERVGLVDSLALCGRDAVAAPLPQLASADLCGRGVLLFRGVSRCTMCGA